MAKQLFEAVGCSKFCPHSLFIPTTQHELYDLHILPLTIRNQQRGSGWDLLFQAINMRSSHLIKHIPPAHCLPSILQHIRSTWKSCPAKPEGTTRLLERRSFTRSGELCLRRDLVFSAGKMLEPVLSPSPVSMQDLGKTVSGVHSLLPGGLVGGEGMEVSTELACVQAGHLSLYYYYYAIRHYLIKGCAGDALFIQKLCTRKSIFSMAIADNVVSSALIH